MKMRDLLSSKVTRNASWIIAGRVYHMLLAFFVGLLTARYLGPGNFGLINYAATYAIALSLLWIIALYHKERIAVRISTHP